MCNDRNRCGGLNVANGQNIVESWQGINGEIVINLPEDFDIRANLGYLERNKNECMFEVENGIITRVIVVGASQTLVQIHVNERNQMIVQVFKGL